MSLAKAVLAIVDQMDQDAREFHQKDPRISAGLVNGQIEDILNGYCRMLRMAVLASGENDPESKEPWHVPKKKREPDKVDQVIEQMLAREEGSGASLALIEGGSLDNDHIPINPKMPVGAKTIIGNEVYILAAGPKLQFSQEETDKVRGKK